MKRMIVGTGLIGLVLLMGTAGCTSKKATMRSGTGGSSAAAASKAATSQVSSDSLEACLARISTGSSKGTRVVAEQSCRENEALRQGVVGTAMEKSGGRASSGTQGDSLDACLARIPSGATKGQRLLAEDTCRRDQSMHR